MALNAEHPIAQRLEAIEVSLMVCDAREFESFEAQCEIADRLCVVYRRLLVAVAPELLPTTPAPEVLIWHNGVLAYRATCTGLA